MSKLTREQKLEIYKRRKQGKTLKELSKEYNIRVTGIQYLIKLIDFHGESILRKDRNRYYSPELKEEIINQVLLQNQSILSTAIRYGLPSSGMLVNWIRSYKTNGYVIIERKKGRTSSMKTNQPEKKYEEMTPEEKVEYLERKTQYLKAENEYLKKLRAVVQARKDQQSKKK